MRANTEADFWGRVDVHGPLPESCPQLGCCWLWQGTLDQDGYGIFKLAGKQWRAGRLALALTTEEIAPELFASPLCKNRACIRPEHLSPSTAREMNLRGDAWSGRNARKTHCPRNHPLIERGCKICACEATKRWQQRKKRAVI